MTGNNEHEDNLVERQYAEIRGLVDENEHLKAQVYNLTLYLNECFNVIGKETVEGQSFYSQMMEKFDGLPGYAPQCLAANY